MPTTNDDVQIKTQDRGLGHASKTGDSHFKMFVHLMLACSEVLTGLPAVEELERPARSVVVEGRSCCLVEGACWSVERLFNLKAQVEERSRRNVEGWREEDLKTWAALFI
jgi:hypothetical protein